MKSKTSFKILTPRLQNSLAALVSMVTFSVFVSCKKFVTIDPPPTEVTTTIVFSDSAAAVATLAGLYSQMMNTNLFFANGGLTLLPGLSSDELTRTSPNSFFDVFTQNAITPDNSLLYGNLWQAAYSYIYHCNAIIEGAGKSSLPISLKDRIIAEARFNRAFCYLYLVSLFGDVPLIIGTDYSTNASLPRSQSSAIYSSIDADLIFAKSRLPLDAAENLHPTKGAVSALLSRLKLYQKDWVAAEANATEVINAGIYSLATSADAVFNPNSSETIWQLMPVQPSFNTAEGNVFIPASPAAKPTYVLTQNLQNIFEVGDARVSFWLKTYTVNNQSYTIPYKYKQRVRLAPGAPPTEYNVVLRLAEQFLIRAEAKARQGKLSETAADLNTIRNRASLANSTANTETALLMAIETERQREFFAEWGHRWFDLKRTGRIDAVLRAMKPTWQPYDALYPIPFNEIQSNPALTQNPGY